jgi:hypothetical protein
MLLRPWQSGVLFLGFTFIYACGAGSDASEDRNATGLHVTKSCEQSACDVQREACEDRRDTCFDQCSLLSSSSQASCFSICAERDCPPCADTSCGVYDYDFHWTGATNRSVLEACERALERDRGCGETVIAPDCETASWAMRPEIQVVFECVARTACSGPVDDCFVTVPVDDFGTQVCAALDESCSPDHCSEGIEAEANKRAPFATDAVRAAGMACIEEAGCANIASCVQNWWVDAFARFDARD